MSGGAGVRRAIAVALIVTGLVRAGLAAAGAVASATTSQQVPGGSYGEFTGLNPARVLDARYGLGTPSGQPEWMTSGDTMDVQIGGRGGVPANGVTAVVLTVTVEAPPFGGYLTIWPAGTPRPEVSNANWGWRDGPVGPPPSNLVTVPLGSEGKVSIITQVENWGGVSPIFDVAGY
jgi:hypothetical protein